MKIDWITVIAQAVNFVILVLLLKRFLYKPIVKAIDDRDKKIADQLQDAANKLAEAKKQQEEFEAKNKEFDDQKSAMMAKAQQDSDAEKKRLIEEARKEADDFRARLLESLQNEEKNLSTEIVNSTKQEVFAITRKTLADLAGATLEATMTDAFVKKLKALDKEEKDQLTKAVIADAGTGAVKIITAFSLEQAQQKLIQDTVNEIFAATKNIAFIVAPELICGIELNANGYKMGWSINDYLNSLQKKVDEILKTKLASEFGAVPTKK
jgi:F-type H+-transporting ATPase subunit b